MRAGATSEAGMRRTCAAAGVLAVFAVAPFVGCTPANSPNVPIPALRATITVNDSVPAIVAADVNADGIDDLIAGDPLGGEYPHTQAGIIHLLLGPVHDIDLTTTRGELRLRGLRPFQQLGVFLAAGDLNGDGVLDIATSTSGPDGRGADFVDEGVVYVVDGTLRGEHDIEPSAFLTLTGPISLGAPVVTGDYNGDGHDDLLLSCALRSEVYAVFGPRSGSLRLPQDADVILYTNNGSFGWSLSARDLNGDGRTELAIADPVHRVVYLIPGGLSGRVAADTAAVSLLRSGRSGDTLMTVHLAELLPDGRARLLVRANRADSENLGTVFLLEDPQPGEIDLRTDSRLILSDVPSAFQGAGIRVGAVSRDGGPLLAIGLPDRRLYPASNLTGELWLLSLDLRGEHILDPADIGSDGYRTQATDVGLSVLGRFVSFARLRSSDRRDLAVTAQGTVLVFELVSGQ